MDDDIKINWEDESIYFPENYSMREKTLSEFLDIRTYYLDAGRNIPEFDSNQRQIIEDIFYTIKELINKKEYQIAQFYIVSLQIVLNLSIRLRKTLKLLIIGEPSITDYIDLDEFYKYNPNKRADLFLRLYKIQLSLRNDNDEVEKKLTQKITDDSSQPQNIKDMTNSLIEFLKGIKGDGPINNDNKPRGNSDDFDNDGPKKGR